MGNPKKTWERVTFTLDDDSITRSRRIHHRDIAWRTPQQRTNAISRAAVTPVCVDTAAQEIFIYKYGDELTRAGTYALSGIQEPVPEDKLADLFTAEAEQENAA